MPRARKRLAEVAAVGVGQADVDHEHVGRDMLDALERLVAGRDRLDLETLLAKAAAEHAAQVGIVLDDEHLGAEHVVEYGESHGSHGARGPLKQA